MIQVSYVHLLGTHVSQRDLVRCFFPKIEDGSDMEHDGRGSYWVES